MKTALRKRYYCDFCRKVGGSKSRMEKHEKGCTNNPDRVCGICAFTGAGGADLKNLITICQPAVDEHGFISDAVQEKVLAELEVASEHCPACIFAAIRQSKAFVTYNVREKLSSFWAEHNSNQREH